MTTTITSNSIWVAVSLLRERDEAREALMEIESVYVDGCDTCADRERMGNIARAALALNTTLQKVK
jgi:hypothetical protein